MSDYRVLPGPNQPLNILTVITPQPMSPGLQATREEFTGQGSIIQMGLYFELSWNVLKGATLVQSLYTLFGIKTIPFSFVTLYARDAAFEYHRYNGIAVRPNPTWENFFPKRITILVRQVELIA